MIGADAIIEFEIIDSAEPPVTHRKGLLVQAKKRSSTSNLLEECRKMNSISSSSCVIDYTDGGYRATKIQDIIKAEGKWSKVPDGHIVKLEDILAGEFLQCAIGMEGMYFDAVSRKLSYVRDGELQTIEFKAGNRTRTSLQVT